MFGSNNIICCYNNILVQQQCWSFTILHPSNSYYFSPLCLLQRVMYFISWVGSILPLFHISLMLLYMLFVLLMILLLLTTLSYDVVNNTVLLYSFQILCISPHLILMPTLLWLSLVLLLQDVSIIMTPFTLYIIITLRNVISYHCPPVDGAEGSRSP